MFDIVFLIIQILKHIATFCALDTTLEKGFLRQLSMLKSCTDVNKDGTQANQSETVKNLNQIDLNHCICYLVTKKFNVPQLLQILIKCLSRKFCLR